MDFPRLDLAAMGQLTFFPPDFEKFPCLQLAFDALAMGGTAPAILNAANEIAVQAFLKEEIRYIDIPVIITKCLDEMNSVSSPSLADIAAIDAETRRVARNECQNVR
jgi:1-deoxy-D-xylulose-5-phosphate reductoisomerase